MSLLPPANIRPGDLPPCYLHHWTPVQTCSLEDLPPPLVLTFSGGHRNTSVGKRVVRILLECCLVRIFSGLNYLTCNHLILFPFQCFCVEFHEWMDRMKVIQIFLQLNTYSCSGFRLFMDLIPWVEFKFRTNRFHLFITNFSKCIATNVTIVLMHWTITNARYLKF